MADIVDPARARLLLQAKHDSPLVAARFSPCGKWLVATAQDSKLIRWDTALKSLTVLEGHKSWVRGLAFAGGRMYSADWTGRILAWDLDESRPKPVWTVAAHKGWARAVATSPDGKV